MARLFQPELAVVWVSLLFGAHTELLQSRGPVCPIGDARSVHHWWLDCDESWQPVADGASREVAETS